MVINFSKRLLKKYYEEVTNIYVCNVHNKQIDSKLSTSFGAVAVDEMRVTSAENKIKNF